MDVVTHALVPVIATRLLVGQPAWLGRKGFLLIGLAGALPDVLNPHLLLAARMTSWTHGLPFWCLFSVLVLGVSACAKKSLPVQLAVALSLSCLLHLVLDSVSGGLDWLSPLGSYVWGRYWIAPIFWMPLDLILLLCAYFVFCWAPRFRTISQRVKSDGQP